MNSNNSQKYLNRNDNRIMHINYKAAQENEELGIYKEAISLYELNIAKFNDPLSKVRLAKLYLEGKTNEIDNKRARTLLEEANNQKCNNARALLAYTLANGIGGKTDKNRAYFMFMDELKDNNPDAMVYIELCKLIPKNENSRKVIKSLKKCVTPFEKIKYARKVSIDKFNNTRLGKIVNKIPNKFSTEFDYIIKERSEEKMSCNLGDLYDKAQKLYKNGQVETARRIYKRLANYGDLDSKIKYAKMCSNAIGGKKDISSAKQIYEEILDRRDRKIRGIKTQISNLEKEIEKLNGEKKSRKKIKQYNEEIQYLKERQGKILRNKNYNEAYLEYGLLTVNNYSNEIELQKGINILKSVAKNGEWILGKNKELTEEGKAHNRRARIAIRKLGKLYESGVWKPENLETEKAIFSKFATSKISGYTSYIVDKMNGRNVRLIKSSNNTKNKKCKLRYDLGSLCEWLHISFFARKLYASMCKSGDFRGAFSLALYEQHGKGGKKDIPSAIKHYRDYIKSTIYSEDKLEKSLRYTALNNLGNIYESQNDIISAIESYKIAAINGNRESKKSLKTLYKQGIWNPENQREYELVKPTVIENVLDKIKSNSLKISSKPKISIPIPNIDIRKQVAVGLAAFASTYIIGDALQPIPVRSENIENKTNVTDQNLDYNYLIGDEVSILNNDIMENSTIVGMVAYNPITESLLDEKIELNYENYGLSSQNYIERIAKEKNIDKKEIKLLYCLKNAKGTKWVNPTDQEMLLIKLYRDIKKEEDFQEYLV